MKAAYAELVQKSPTDVHELDANQYKLCKEVFRLVRSTIHVAYYSIEQAPRESREPYLRRTFSSDVLLYVCFHPALFIA